VIPVVAADCSVGVPACDGRMPTRLGSIARGTRALQRFDRPFFDAVGHEFFAVVWRSNRPGRIRDRRGRRPHNGETVKLAPTKHGSGRPGRFPARACPDTNQGDSLKNATRSATLRSVSVGHSRPLACILLYISGPCDQTADAMEAAENGRPVPNGRSLSPWQD